MFSLMLKKDLVLIISPNHRKYSWTSQIQTLVIRKPLECIISVYPGKTLAFGSEINN